MRDVPTMIYKHDIIISWNWNSLLNSHEIGLSSRVIFLIIIYEGDPQFIIKIVYSYVVDIKNYYFQVLSSIIFQTSSGENDWKKKKKKIH